MLRVGGCGGIYTKEGVQDGERDPKCLTGEVIRDAMILDVYGRCRDVV